MPDPFAVDDRLRGGAAVAPLEMELILRWRDLPEAGLIEAVFNEFVVSRADAAPASPGAP